MLKSFSRMQFEAETKKSGRSLRGSKKLVLGPEGEQQAAFFRWLAGYEAQFPAFKTFHSTPNESKGYMDGAKRKALGRKPGVPDTHLPQMSVIDDKIYIGLWLEFKAPGKKLSEEQEAWFGMLREAGHWVELIYDWQVAANITIDYLHLGIKKFELN